MEKTLDFKMEVKLSDFFQALSDNTRIKIIYLLKSGELSVGEITQQLDITQSAVSHQLRVLRNVNLVSFEKKGKLVYYQLADQHVNSIIDQAIEHIEHGG